MMRNSKVFENGCLSLFRAAVLIMTPSPRDGLLKGLLECGELDREAKIQYSSVILDEE